MQALTVVLTATALAMIALAFTGAPWQTLLMNTTRREDFVREKDIRWIFLFVHYL
jgi:hypothetical protein